jgi:D-alanine transaminase/branched-chain amino acid aminotransferase
MNLTLPPIELLEQQILTLIEKNANPVLGVKMIATGGESLDGYAPAETTTFVLAKPFQIPSRDINLKLMTMKYRRELADIKTLNYIAPIQTLPQQQAVGAHDVLYHYGGYISESSRSNIFIVKNEKLITPKSFILNGITRQNILEVAKPYFEIEERAVKLTEVWDADEVIMASSTRRVSRIGQVDNHQFHQTKVMQKIYDLLLEKEKM